MLKALLSALPLIGKLIDWLNGRQQAQKSAEDRKAGSDAVEAQTLRNSFDAIERARAAALDQSRHDVAGLHDDDGFKRAGGTDDSLAKPASKT